MNCAIVGTGSSPRRARRRAAVLAAADTAFAPIEASIRAQDGPDASGVMLLDSNEQGLTWRLALIDSARHSLDLQYYVWFGDAGGALLMKRVVQAAKRGVKVRILTNSLASHDVPAVNSHYEEWRTPILQTGAKLYEIRPDAAVKASLADTAPTRGAFMGLHTKAMVSDRQRVFIGSMNLDPRSGAINSEMGVVVESPGLARTLAATMERDRQPANSWQVELDAAGHLRWVTGDQVLTAQPARNAMQRVEDVVFKAFPKDLY